MCRSAGTRSVVGLLAFFLLAAVPACRAAEPALPVPVATVDLERYAGLWYEIARIPNRFQKQCVSDVTAEYLIQKDGHIRVVNSCAEENGDISRSEGVAKVVDSTTNSRLKVSFVSILGIRPFWGDYWILGLGDEYEYAVVGTPNRKYGWVLARRPDPAPETMERVWRIVAEQGYDVGRFTPGSH